MVKITRKTSHNIALQEDIDITQANLMLSI